MTTTWEQPLTDNPPQPTLALTYTLPAITNHTPGTEEFWAENDTYYELTNNEIHEWENHDGKTFVKATIIVNPEEIESANPTNINEWAQQTIEADYKKLVGFTPEIEEI